MPTAGEALPGRRVAMPVADRHTVLGTPLQGPWPAGAEVAYFGMGCFWGAERMFWQLPGVFSTAGRLRRAASPRTRPTRRSAPAAPATPKWSRWSTTRPRSPTTTCSRRSGRTTTRPRACARATTSARSTARRSTPPPTSSWPTAHGVPGRVRPGGPRRRPRRDHHRDRPAADFYYAEDYHQQYLRKNPNGYCNPAPTA